MSASTLESGIDLDFELPSDIEVLLNSDISGTDNVELVSDPDSTRPKQPTFYQLISRSVEDIPSSPKEDKPSLNPMTSRTNLKQQLMRQQQLQQEERERQAVLKAAAETKSHTNAVEVPSTLATIPEVPAQVLHVNTRLANPTRFHVEEKKRQQVKEFLSQSHTGSPQRLTIQSSRMTPPISPSHNTKPLGSPASTNLSMSAQSTDLDEFLEDVLSLGSSLGDDMLVNTLDPAAHLSATLPTTNFLDLTPSNVTPIAVATTSQSCPTDMSLYGDELVLTEEQAKAFVKDRQKKDNHNMIERRRRFNINDRIKELGTLLPTNGDPDQRINKGTILKSSVDYIRRLRKDASKMKQEQERSRSLENINRKMLLRIQELEMHCRAHGINPTPLSNDTSTANITQEFLKQQPPLNLEINEELPERESTSSSSFLDLGLNSTLDDMMDDSMSPISNDPLLSASSPMDSQLSSIDDDLLMS
ncbi:microphthalmia-associated transcription factor [Saccoglossus kowalevskii]|uniref:Microphthalmia-associated transcription factor n=1 Tax=Saccoglossus kowalevskii TaxID=10224 RepID=D1LX65_SACKO|nr:microphthalmia-associated transcription factor [Saccoglossus kowalevskii]ACY92571.1 microphthalmia-associated transcription factor [Saccoglossus kowalevskii]